MGKYGRPNSPAYASLDIYSDRRIAAKPYRHPNKWPVITHFQKLTLYAQIWYYLPW